jgi:rubrerythrin
MGMNKTGLETAPQLSKEMMQSSQNGPVSQGNGGVSADAVRAEYIKEAGTVGSVPPPTSLKGAAKSAAHALKGEKATVLIDKLGERMAFERTGTRLYEALITKCKALGTSSGGSLVDELEHICGEELEHFHMLWDCLKQLGADPTVETPSADVSALASEGIPKVVTDPRTTLAHGLQAILVAELVDNEGWEMLVELAEDFDQTDMAERFRGALAEEENHLVIIREALAREIHQEAEVGAS